MLCTIYLSNKIDDDYKEGVSKVKEKPNFNRLDTCCCRKAFGYRQVDGGKDHHAGNVYSYKKIKSTNIIGSLIDDVDEKYR